MGKGKYKIGVNIMPNQTSETFAISWDATLEKRGADLAKLEQNRVRNLEALASKDATEGAKELGDFLEELALISDQHGRISSDILKATKMNLVASQRRAEARYLSRNYDKIIAWKDNRVVTKRKQKIAFTSLTAMLKAFKAETQPKVEKTDDKSSGKPNVGTTQPKAETQDAKASDAQPKKVEKVRVPQNSKEFADYVHKLTIKFGFDKDEVLEAIFDSFENKTAKKRVA
jgi:hypothetical protein